MAAIIKEAKSSGVFHQGAVFASPNANRGRHWSIHPEWPIEGQNVIGDTNFEVAGNQQPSD